MNDRLYLRGLLKKIHPADILRFLLDLIYPENLYCICCGDYLDPKERKDALCPKCIKKINWINVNPFANRMDDFVFDELIACCIYGYFPRQIIHKFKLGGGKELARPLAKFMADRVDEYNKECGVCMPYYDCICPVPSTEEKIRERGYNQAELLAKYVSRELDIPVIDLLIKTDGTHSQRLKSGQSRRSESSGFFFNPEKEIKNGACVLLIDDVLTTGSTANECAAALKNAGAQSVCVCVFAASAGREKSKTE